MATNELNARISTHQTRPISNRNQLRAFCTAPPRPHQQRSPGVGNTPSGLPGHQQPKYWPQSSDLSLQTAPGGRFKSPGARYAYAAGRSIGGASAVALRAAAVVPLPAPRSGRGRFAQAVKLQQLIKRRARCPGSSSHLARTAAAPPRHCGSREPAATRTLPASPRNAKSECRRLLDTAFRAQRLVRGIETEHDLQIVDATPSPQPQRGAIDLEKVVAIAGLAEVGPRNNFAVVPQSLVAISTRAPHRIKIV
ncbi:hypothetical protein CERSUDRAFT_100856 [Gelatoporia subvermispora B]|uniref:Uncharacterized protein n=1 Tax=Ceriporiopsis subvermispora (strain B) TaxID=914234 RepID=M2P6M9_CERS8|nr:hypothetical protein CERSUDRAFT_100856 [Gelatoporia subvermispora B]